MPRACGWWGSVMLVTSMVQPAWAQVGAQLESFEAGAWARNQALGRVETRLLEQPGRCAIRYRGKAPGEVWLVVEAGRIESQVLAIPLESDSTEILARLEAFLVEGGIPAPPGRQVWQTILAAVEGQSPVLVTGGVALAAGRLELPVPLLLVAIAREVRTLPLKPTGRQPRSARSVHHMTMPTISPPIVSERPGIPALSTP